jgi:prevent-host-death family protein
MRTVNAKEANYNSGQLIDTARAGPVTVVKYGRAVVVVLAVEEYERLRALDETVAAQALTNEAKK